MSLVKLFHNDIMVRNKLIEEIIAEVKLMREHPYLDDHEYHGYSRVIDEVLKPRLKAYDDDPSD